MRTLKKYMIIGVIFVSILGTLLHFAYNWSGNNLFIGLFVPINESIWEHTKLIFFPLLMYSFYLNKKIISRYPCINSAIILGEIFSIISIIISYYTYTGIIGFNFAFIDITIFYISVILSFYVIYKSTLSCKVSKYKPILTAFEIIMFILYITFSIYPPEIPVFVVPN